MGFYRGSKGKSYQNNKRYKQTNYGNNNNGDNFRGRQYRGRSNSQYRQNILNISTCSCQHGSENRSLHKKEGPNNNLSY